jgi:hypothetical protein
LNKETESVLLPNDFHNFNQIIKITSIKDIIVEQNWNLNEIITIIPVYDFQLKYVYVGGTLIGQYEETEIITESREFINEYIQEMKKRQEYDDGCDHLHENFSWENGGLFECTMCGNLRNTLNENICPPNILK